MGMQKIIPYKYIPNSITPSQREEYNNLIDQIKHMELTMQVQIHAIHDLASKTYQLTPPVISKRDAIEAFTSAVNKEGTMLNKYPADYSLVLIGNYDDNTGTLTPVQHEIITTAPAVKEHKNATIQNE